MNSRNLETRTQPKKPQEEQAYFSVVQYMINKGKDAGRPQRIDRPAIPDGISFLGPSAILQDSIWVMVVDEHMVRQGP